MKNNYEVKITIMIAGKAKKIRRLVHATSEQDAANRAEEFYEEQGYAAFCKATGFIDNLLPWDIS